MTFATIRKSVRGLLADTAYDSDAILEAANWFVYELFNSTRTRLMESSDTIEAAQGEVTADFPDDLMTRISIYMVTPQVVNMKSDLLSYDNFMGTYANYNVATPARAREWTVYGNAMRFAAPLDTDHVFSIDYLRTPVPMTNDRSECEVPDNYSELVSKGTLARLMEVNEDYAEAAQERTNLEPLVTTFIRNEARGGGSTDVQVAGTGRRGRSNYRADKDF